jgi:hypothetical protein
MSRASLATLLLTAWVAALGWQAKRIYFPAEAQRLAAGMRLLPPGVAYYAVYRGSERVGWAQVEIDTLPDASGFHVRDRVFLDLAALGAAGRSERESDEYLDAGLNLDSLTHTAIAGDDTSRVRIVSAGDSMLVFFDSEGRETNRVPTGEAVTTSSGWRLRLAAAGRAEAGQRFGALVVDPLVEIARAEEIEVMEATSLAFPDSADTDSISGAWIPVREDTVRAWRLRTGQGSGQREAWVDEDGRLVDGQIFGGLRVERTAFELAFFTRSPTPPEFDEEQPPQPEEPN